MQQQEDAFCKVLDAAAEYVRIREQLGANLKTGHLQLAKARYAMGPSSIGSANYSSIMQATSQVLVSHADINPFQPTGRPEIAGSSSSPGSSPKGSNKKTVDSSPPSTSRAVEAHDGTSTMQADAGLDAIAEAQSSHSGELDGKNQYSSDAISELAAKFGTTHVDRHNPTYKSAAPKDPLKWFGFMVSPHLRQSQADFKDAVPLLVELANAQHRIHSALNVITHCQLIHETV